MKPPITVIPKPGGEVEERTRTTRTDLKSLFLQAHEDFMFANSLNGIEANKALKALEKQTAHNLKKEKEVGEILKNGNDE